MTRWRNFKSSTKKLGMETPLNKQQHVIVTWERLTSRPTAVAILFFFPSPLANNSKQFNHFLSSLSRLIPDHTGVRRDKVRQPHSWLGFNILAAHERRTRLVTRLPLSPTQLVREKKTILNSCNSFYKQDGRGEEKNLIRIRKWGGCTRIVQVQEFGFNRRVIMKTSVHKRKCITFNYLVDKEQLVYKIKAYVIHFLFT